MKKIGIILIIMINVGCLNMFRTEALYDGNSVSAEAVKGTTAYIELNTNPENLEIQTTKPAILTAKVYNKFDVYIKNTEISFYVNGIKEQTTSDETYEFKSENIGYYKIYAQKGDITSSAIIITVK